MCSFPIPSAQEDVFLAFFTVIVIIISDLVWTMWKVNSIHPHIHRPETALLLCLLRKGERNRLNTLWWLACYLCFRSCFPHQDLISLPFDLLHLDLLSTYSCLCAPKHIDLSYLTENWLWPHHPAQVSLSQQERDRSINHNQIRVQVLASPITICVALTKLLILIGLAFSALELGD